MAPYRISNRCRALLQETGCGVSDRSTTDALDLRFYGAEGSVEANQGNEKARQATAGWSC